VKLPESAPGKVLTNNDLNRQLCSFVGGRSRRKSKTTKKRKNKNKNQNRNLQKEDVFSKKIYVFVYIYIYMAYKSIKKGKGKRKGGKKSNRITYKQRGGVNMEMLVVMLTIGMLATLNIIYRLPNEQTSHLRGYIEDNSLGPGPYYLGVDSTGSEVQTVFNVAQTASHLRKEVTNNYPLIDNPVVVTEAYLQMIIRQKISGVVDEKKLINKLMENFQINSVLKDGPPGAHYYVIGKETLDSMIGNLIKSIDQGKFVKIDAGLI